MDFTTKSQDEILAIAEPILTNLVLGSNENDYERLSKHFSKVMLESVPKGEYEKQHAENSPETGNILEKREFLSCIYRDSGVTVLWKGYFEKKDGEILAQMTLDDEDGEIKVYNVFIG
jgi:hypothetical protein